MLATTSDLYCRMPQRMLLAYTTSVLTKMKDRGVELSVDNFWLPLPFPPQVTDAQQYMFHAGHPPLLQWARQIVDMCHAPPCPTQSVITSGAVCANGGALPPCPCVKPLMVLLFACQLIGMKLR